MRDFINGTVRVSNDIIDRIIAEAAIRTEGVYRVYGYRKGQIEKRRTEGIVAVIHDEKVQAALTISVKEGYPVHKVAAAVQEAVHRDIKVMLGLEVTEINVFVHSIHFEAGKSK